MKWQVITLNTLVVFHQSKNKLFEFETYYLVRGDDTPSPLNRELLMNFVNCIIFPSANTEAGDIQTTVFQKVLRSIRWGSCDNIVCFGCDTRV